MWKCCSCLTKSYEAPEVLELDYRHSSLSEVPADIFTFERTLEKLDLGSNQICDLPPSLFHCHELRELDLCDNDLMSIPPAVGSLTRLCKLDLSRNAISEVADSIKNCRNLAYIDLSMNHLTKLPEGISQLVNLEELFLNDTYLEFLHANFGRLTRLRVLELRENSLQTLPKSMNRLHHLQRLDLGQNDLNELPEVVGTMTNLTEFWCDNNNLRVLPKFLGNLSKLHCFDASHNEIQVLAEEIGKCGHISDMTLSANSLESLPEQFSKLESLSVLRLDSNSLSHLPESFGNLKNLHELSLVSNVLKALPLSFGLLRKLHTVYLDDNLLTALPKEIGSCTNLTVLSVAKNRLKELPSEIGHLINLKVLSVAGNLLVHLPVSVLNIPKLGAIWLSETQSKPLLPLNKEIDPVSGKHVLTCYLLPQMPSTGDDYKKYTEQSDDEIRPRRSKPTIKFVTDVESIIIESNVNKRGLLRAPTPYPKELRALAKHASHIRQSSKEHNGEVINTDEPEYEGDYPEDMTSNHKGDFGGDRIVNSISSKKIEPVHPPVDNVNQLKLSEKPAGTNYPKTNNSNVPSTAMNTIGLPPTPSISYTSSSSKSFLSHATTANAYPQASFSSTFVTAHSQTSAIVPNEHNETTGGQLESTKGDSRYTRLPELSIDKSSRETYGNSATEMARKSPPPYHVAARRAAFFRSSGGAGTGRIDSPTQEIQGAARASPVIGRMFPLPLPVDTMVYSTTTASVASSVSSPTSDAPLSQDEDMKEVAKGDAGEYREDDGDNEKDHLRLVQDKTFTVSKDADDSDGDVVSTSTEENLDAGSSLDLDKRPIDSKNLVKTIESALEKVDKRTTEFLKDDRWQDLSNDEEADFPPPPSEEEIMYTNLPSSAVGESNQHVDQTDSSIASKSGTSSTITTSNSSQGGSAKGPIVPPKPSPLLSRIQNPIKSNNQFHAASFDSSGSSTSRIENQSRIPTFNSPSSSSSSVNKLSNASIAGLKPPASYTSPAPSCSAASTIGKPLSENVIDNTHRVANIGVTSRIPKLPSLTNSFQRYPTALNSPSSNEQSHSKPEVLSPKPQMTKTHVATSSRIPSFGTMESRPKEDMSPLPITITQKTSIIPAKYSTGKSQIQDNININVDLTPDNINSPSCKVGTRIPRFDSNSERHELVRTGSGTRIPKLNDNSKACSFHTAAMNNNLENSNSVTNIGQSQLSDNDTDSSSSLSNIPGVSRIPSIGKKPWIFGTHRNARVVALEFKKMNSLGFNVSDGAGQNMDGHGVFVIGTDEMDSTLKVGDKILQVDGIDVSNMGLEIVKKILSNCQDTINLLVSRQS